jgi:hypothetical protein
LRAKEPYAFVRRDGPVGYFGVNSGDYQREAMMNLVTTKTLGPMSLVLFVLLCATAQGQPDPLISGNNGTGIATTVFGTGPTVDFIPDGATNYGMTGVLVLGNNVYYTELGYVGQPVTVKIRIAPFNGGTGGADIGSLPNPRPGCEVRNLAYHDGYIYALAGFGFCCPTLQVFKIAVGGTVWSSPVNLPSACGDTTADGFTLLVNNGVVTFLVNTRFNEPNGSCRYHEYNSTTGAPTGNGFVVSGFGGCSGVDTSDNDTDGTHVLYFAVGPGGPGGVLINQIHSATLTPSFTLTGPSTTFTPGDSWGSVQDISLVHGHGFVGTPGAPNCHGQSVSALAQTFGGMPNAAAALGYSSVKDLQDAIRAFCG